MYWVSSDKNQEKTNYFDLNLFEKWYKSDDIFNRLKQSFIHWKFFIWICVFWINVLLCQNNFSLTFNNQVNENEIHNYVNSISYKLLCSNRLKRIYHILQIKYTCYKQKKEVCSLLLDQYIWCPMLAVDRWVDCFDPSLALSHAVFGFNHKVGKDRIVDRNCLIGLVQAKWSHKRKKK